MPNEFILKTCKSMFDLKQPEYAVRQFALGYFQQGYLTENDLETVDSWFDTKTGEK